MAEDDISKFTWAARNQEYLLRLFQKNNRNMDLQLELLETIMLEQDLPIWQKQEKEIYYKYILRFKNYKYVGWLTLPFVFKTQTSNKYEGQTYTTLVLYRTILPNNKDTNAIQNQIICS